MKEFLFVSYLVLKKAKIYLCFFFGKSTIGNTRLSNGSRNSGRNDFRSSSPVHNSIMDATLMESNGK